MSATKEERATMNEAMFGCDPDEMIDINCGDEPDAFELNMLAASILSDAQHVLENGDAETSRKYMNRAKYCIFKANKLLRG